MTGEREDRRRLAAEYALGALEGAELEQARALASSDGEFRNEVARWSGRMAPLFEEVEPVAPPDTLWRRIEERLGARPANDNVLVLRRRIGLWRGIAAGAMALAASLAIVLVTQPPQGAAPAGPPAGPPMVAMLGDRQEPMKVVASWDPGTRQLVLAVPADMPAAPSQAHELWVIPADGKPRSLGTMGDSRMTHMQLADALAQLLQQGATIAISVEPPGGSPTGAPTGPVVAAGALTRA